MNSTVWKREHYFSRSPLYSKQMPYNSVIYYAFGRSTLASSPTKPKVYQRRASKQKKVVVGKLCGKIWMSNQVHPLLAKRNSEDDDEKIVHGWSLPNKKIERSESGHTDSFTTRKYAKKRKTTVEIRKARKGNFTEREYVSYNCIEEKYNPQQRTYSKIKQAKYFDQLEDHFQKPCGTIPKSRQNKCKNKIMVDSSNNYSHLLHRTPKRKQVKSMGEEDMNSND